MDDALPVRKMSKSSDGNGDGSWIFLHRISIVIIVRGGNDGIIVVPPSPFVARTRCRALADVHR